MLTYLLYRQCQNNFHHSCVLPVFINLSSTSCPLLPTPSCSIQLEHIKGTGAKSNVDPTLLPFKVPSKLSTDLVQLRQQSQPYCYLRLQCGVFITARLHEGFDFWSKTSAAPSFIRLLKPLSGRVLII